MRIATVFDGVFWGVVLIALGVWFLLRRYVPVHIPVFRIFVAIVFVYVGVRVLVVGTGVRDRNTVVFSESNMTYAPGSGRDYNVIFSSGTVDLTGAAPEERERAEVNVVFGNGVLKVDGSRPVRVRMSSAFGTVEAPDERSVAFEDAEWSSPSWQEGGPGLDIKATAVFGRLVIEPSP